MKLPRASLVRRLTVGFAISQLAGLFLVLLILLPVSREGDVDQIGTGVAISILKEGVVETNHGLQLRRGSGFAAFASETPGVWFVARKGQHILRWIN